MLKLKVKDFVKVIAGKHKNKTGLITKIIDNKWVTVENIFATKHFKPTQQEQGKGKIDKIPFKIHISNVAYCDKKSNKVFKIKFDFDKNNFKVRKLKKNNTIIEEIKS